MPLRTQRALQALVLAALGLFFAQKIWSGSLYWYINERFLALSILAAVGFVVLAQAVSFRRAAPSEPREAGHAHPDHDRAHGRDHDHLHHDHAHGSLSAWALVLVALPVILGVLVPARPLGSSAIANRGLNTSAPPAGASGGTAQRLELAPTERTVLDWVRAFNYEADPAVFAGQPADVIGFVYHDVRLDEGRFFTGRFAVSCCVADAAGIAVIAEWPEAASLPDNSWVRVRGPVRVAQFDGRPVPLIAAESVEPVPPPDQPYLYP